MAPPPSLSEWTETKVRPERETARLGRGIVSSTHMMWSARQRSVSCSTKRSFAPPLS